MSSKRTQKVSAYFQARRIRVGKTPAGVLERARSVIERLEQGIPYWQLRGKRTAWNRRLISIPLGRKWRLLAVDQDGQVTPQEVLSHARYNDLGGQHE